MSTYILVDEMLLRYMQIKETRHRITIQVIHTVYWCMVSKSYFLIKVIHPRMGLSGDNICIMIHRDVEFTFMIYMEIVIVKFNIGFM